MKIGKKAFFAIAAAVFCVLYIVFAIKPLKKEYQFNPEWKIDVANPPVTQVSESEELLPFKLGQTMGYFTADGKVSNFISFPYKSSINQSGYVFYNANNTKTDVYFPDGKKRLTLSQSGFPYLVSDKIFVFQPGGTSFLMCDDEGKTKWSYNGISPISSFSTSKNAVAAGFTDGTICEFDNDGNLINRFSPTGSNYPGIHGIDVSDDGKLLACLSGLDQQRFILCSIEGSNSKIIYHQYIDDYDSLQKIVKFSEDNKTVLFNHGNHLSIIDADSKNFADIDLNGHAIKIIEDKNNFYVLSKAKDTYSVHIIEKFATLTGSFSFKAETAFIEAKNGNLYVGRDCEISCIKITRE